MASLSCGDTSLRILAKVVRMSVPIAGTYLKDRSRMRGVMVILPSHRSPDANDARTSFSRLVTELIDLHQRERCETQFEYEGNSLYLDVVAGKDNLPRRDDP